MGEDRRRSRDNGHGNGAGPHPVDGHDAARSENEDALLQRLWQRLWQGIGPHGPDDAAASVHAAGTSRGDATAPGHPDHQLLLQSMAAVGRMEAGLHRARDRNSDRLAACLVVAAKQSGLDRIDHVVLSGRGEHAFAVQGDMGSPFRRMARVPTGAAIQTPVGRSLHDIEVVNGALEAERARRASRDEAPAQDPARAATPVR